MKIICRYKKISSKDGARTVFNESSPMELTRREMELLRLISEGLSYLLIRYLFHAKFFQIAESQANFLRLHQK